MSEPLTEADVLEIGELADCLHSLEAPRIHQLICEWREQRAALAVACHIKADDKIGFDFAVLGKIDELETQLAERDKRIAELEHGSRIGKENFDKERDKRIDLVEKLAGIAAWADRVTEAAKPFLEYMGGDDSDRDALRYVLNERTK